MMIKRIKRAAGVDNVKVVNYLGLEQGTLCVLTLSHICSPPW